jgi:hypothetical protein
MHSETENYSHKINDPKIFATYMQGLGISIDPEWRLLRLEDGLIKKSSAIMWLEWGDNDRIKSTHHKPKVGRSLIMSPFNKFFTWQTTPLTEIIEEEIGYIKFKTKNSTYELSTIKNDKKNFTKN